MAKSSNLQILVRSHRQCRARCSRRYCRGPGRGSATGGSLPSAPAAFHGGLRYSRPARLTPELLTELEALVPLAPLHEPYNLAPIKMAMTLNPGLPQVACFDTAFHRTAPEVDQAFALPYSFYDKGIRRYGFHGLSYEYIASVLPERAPDIANARVVVAHLGNGCSACAMRDRVSIATTMGFTALDGLPMGTRCGELDAGVVLYLIQQKGMSPDDLVDLLY